MIFSIEGLSIKDKDSQKNIVEDINIYISKGDFILLKGESGSGKSTLIRYMSGLILPSHEINYSKKTENGSIKGVMQTAMASLNPAFKVCEHFALINKDGKDLLKILGLNDNIYNSYPHSLSGGMAVRVVLALMLVLEPDILLLDEIDTSLDSKTLQLVINCLQQYNNNGLAVLVVSHQSHLFDNYANKFCKMSDGKILNE